MTDVILNIRLNFDDRKKDEIPLKSFIEWLNQKVNKPTLEDLSIEFVSRIFTEAKVNFEEFIPSQFSLNVKKDPFLEYRHPKLFDKGKWYLDDVPIENKQTIWIKLENQWIKGKIKSIGNVFHITIEPENIMLPINENSYLSWYIL